MVELEEALGSLQRCSRLEVSELSVSLGCLFLLTLETGESLTGTRTAQNISIGDGHKHLDENFGSL